MTGVGAFTSVLGHDRVLLEAGPVAARRVTAREEGTIQGVAAFTPLYGRAAEGVVAVRDILRFDVISELLERLLEILVVDSRPLVRFVLSADQVGLAERLLVTNPGARLFGRELSLRTSAPSPSVVCTDPIGHPLPMRGDDPGRTVGT